MLYLVSLLFMFTYSFFSTWNIWMLINRPCSGSYYFTGINLTLWLFLTGQSLIGIYQWNTECCWWIKPQALLVGDFCRGNVLFHPILFTLQWGIHLSWKARKKWLSFVDFVWKKILEVLLFHTNELNMFWKQGSSIRKCSFFDKPYLKLD